MEQTPSEQFLEDYKRQKLLAAARLTFTATSIKEQSRMEQSLVNSFWKTIRGRSYSLQRVGPGRKESAASHCRVG